MKRWKGRTLLVAAACAGVLWAAVPVRDAAAAGEDTVTLAADQLDYDGTTGVVRALGKVQLRQGGLSLIADELFWQEPTRDVVASGEVHISESGGDLHGRRVQANLATGLGLVDDGRVFVRERNFHLVGAELERLGEASYRVTGGRFTTCDGEVPDWQFRAAQVDVDLGRYATARHVWFEIRNRPLLYLPYLVFPVKSERESGFLLPRVGYSSSKGALLSLAWYEVIDHHLDATVYLDYLSRLGIGKGLEYRYALGGDIQGEALVYHVSGVSGHEDSFAFDWQHDGHLPGKVRLAADIQYVDQREFFSDFGETPEEYNRDHTISTLLAQRNWGKLNLTGYARYIKDLESDRDDPWQRLPELGLDVPLFRLDTAPLYARTELRATHFQQDGGDDGQRLFLRQGLGMVFKPGSWLEFSPEVAVYARGYDGQDGSESDLLAEYSAMLSTRLQRVYPCSLGGIDRLQHSIEPQVTYRYIANTDQDDLPMYDLKDRIGPLNLVEYALVNRLTARITAADGAPAYRELLNLRLSQAYDIREERDDSGDDEPFSDLRAELALHPNARTSLSVDALIKVYDAVSFSRVNAEAAYADGRGNGGRLLYSYRKTGDDLTRADYLDTEYLGLRLDTSLLAPVYASVEQRYDLIDHASLETLVNLEYRARCWSLFVTFRDRPEGEEVLVGFALSGLGRVGGFGSSLRQSQD